MAQEQLAMQTSQSLILQTEQEKMLEKLFKKKSDILKNNFFRDFLELSDSFFDLYKEELRKFSINELKALEELISRKARHWAIAQMIFASGVPIFGWITWLEVVTDSRTGFCSWRYLRYRKRLQKIYGENFFSVILKHNGWNESINWPYRKI